VITAAGRKMTHDFRKIYHNRSTAFAPFPRGNCNSPEHRPENRPCCYRVPTTVPFSSPERGKKKETNSSAYREYEEEWRSLINSRTKEDPRQISYRKHIRVRLHVRKHASLDIHRSTELFVTRRAACLDRRSRRRRRDDGTGRTE